LRIDLLEYSEVFYPITETVPGVEYKIILKPDENLFSLNRPAFRHAQIEIEQERKEVGRLLQRGIVEPSSSFYDTNKF
jgi:hypothetical protein